VKPIGLSVVENSSVEVPSGDGLTVQMDSDAKLTWHLPDFRTYRDLATHFASFLLGLLFAV